jgi:hypothetical protein
MGNMFGKEKPLKEVLRENKRMITRAVRELDREKASLEKEEKRLVIEIKKAAKEQQMTAVKIMAKVRPILPWLFLSSSIPSSLLRPVRVHIIGSAVSCFPVR